MEVEEDPVKEPMSSRRRRGGQSRFVRVNLAQLLISTPFTLDSDPVGMINYIFTLFKGSRWSKASGKRKWRQNTIERTSGNWSAWIRCADG